eukprot:scaffold85325_cov30-Tisochrysis_lutea.AAC.6
MQCRPLFEFIERRPARWFGKGDEAIALGLCCPASPLHRSPLHRPEIRTAPFASALLVVSGTLSPLARRPPTRSLRPEADGVRGVLRRPPCSPPQLKLPQEVEHASVPA